jgi:hypothetical protein
MEGAQRGCKGKKSKKKTFQRRGAGGWGLNKKIWDTTPILGVIFAFFSLVGGDFPEEKIHGTTS